MARRRSIIRKFLGIWWIRTLFLIPLGILLLSVDSAGGQQPRETRRVLILIAGSIDVPGYELARKGMQASLEQGNDFQFEYFIEFMDLYRFKDESYKENLFDLYRTKYFDRNIDLVLTIGFFALDFAAAHGHDIFPGAPVVFCTVLKKHFESLNLNQNVTGSLIEIDYLGLLQTALKIHPNTQHVAIVTGTSPVGRLIKSQSLSKYAPLVDKYDFMYLDHMPMSDMLDRLATLPKDSVVIYFVLSLDATGKAFKAWKVASMVSGAANAPTYGVTDTYLGQGVVGGRVMSFAAQGRKAGEIGLRILNGENPADIPITAEGTILNMFDERQLKRWGIDEGHLPEDRVILFKKLSLWDSYRLHIIGGISIILVQSIFLCVFFYQKRMIKQREQQLRESDERFRAYMRHSNEGIWCVEFDEPIDINLPADEQSELVSKRGYIAEANDAYGRLFGFGRGAELVGYRLEAFWKRFDSRSDSIIKDLIRERYSLTNAETIVRREDGVSQHVLNNAIGIFEAGRVVRVWGTLTDITLLKKTEKALSEAKDFNKAILNSIEDHICVLDANGSILAVNDSWTRFGRENGADLSLIGTGVNYLDICRRASSGPDDSSAEQISAKAALKGINGVLEGSSQSFFMEYPCQLPTQKLWFQMAVLPFKGAKGRLVVSHRNITARKEMDDLLIKAERKYRTVADFTYDWEYWEAPDGGLIYVSPSCERITGYSVSEFMARPERMAEIVIPEDRSIWRSHRHGFQTNLETRPSQCNFRIQSKDGSTRWIAHVCQPVYNEQGDFNGVRSSNRDVTKRQMAEQQVHEHRELLAHLDRKETLGQLTASIAHELNQPLTGILSDAQAGELLLDQEHLSKAEIREIFTDIVADAKRAGLVLRTLRELYAKDKLEFHSFSLNALVRETFQLLNSELVIQGVAPRMDLSENLPNINGNRVQLQQVLINLISNSRQALKNAATADQWVSINTALIDDDKVWVCVEDNGPGIDGDRLTTIFEPLTTTKTTGLGMGLAISKSIIQAHEGRIWAENSPIGGAKIQITLPVGS